MVGLGRLAVLSALGALALPAGEGLAATVGTDDTGASFLLYNALPGETNTVVFTIEGPTTIRVTDSSAPLTSDFGCVPAGADLLCEVADPTRSSISAYLEDGNDRADISVANSGWVDGGPGDDEIIGAWDSYLWGGSGNDQLTGGAGWDFIHGGAGNDTMRGGSGSDEILGSDGDDLVLGGSGFDRTSAGGTNLRLTPTALIATEGSGSDTIAGIDLVIFSAGDGNDVINARTFRAATLIFAGRGDDVIVGGFGRDRIRAGPGNDVVAGRAGRDELSGGPGDDVLFSRDLMPDQVVGDRGRDRARVDRLDTTRLIEVFFF